ncbi:GNAT family N-acetyltransferase [Priestia megaterium]|nr:GNAT family N-acetyltransferase [Priestia megaterium]
MNISILNNLDNVDWSRMKDIYHSVGWEKHDEVKIKKIFSLSNVIAIAYYKGEIVGFGRGVSDGVFNAAIYDVVIEKTYQNKGIGRQIIRNLLDQLKDISCVHLVATTGNEEFYRKLGFSNMKTGMARYLNPVLTAKYLE